jgi:NAD+ diphosphatase
MSPFRFCPLCAALLVDGYVNQEPRQLCSAKCGFVHYDNPTPVVAAVVEHQGCVVLAHNRSWPPHMRRFYGLITGFLERGESPEQCVRREVKEELALDAQAATLIGVYPFERMNQVIIAYHVPATGTIVLNDELDDHRHVPLHECRAWSSGTGLALRDWLRTRGIEPLMLDLTAAAPPRVPPDTN